jgi:1-acyl-sn-glycerol-3-phosphate acyltransferase
VLAKSLSLLFWLFIAVSSLALFPVAVLIWAVTSPFDRRKRVLHLFTCFWASLYTWLNPVWRVHVHHRERILHDRPVVMVANHLSLLDILILFRLFTHFKWVSKIENFRVPCIGWNMTLNGYVPLKRGDRESVIRMMRACEKTLAAGNSIMMFPEGTRSTTGRMRSWKTGAFELALASRVPIQPIVLTGSGNALPKRGFVLQGRHEIEVTVLDPIMPESFEGKTAEDLTDEVRALLAAELGEKQLTEAAPAD